jgi:hypothetical protein
MWLLGVVLVLNLGELGSTTRNGPLLATCIGFLALRLAYNLICRMLMNS